MESLRIGHDNKGGGSAWFLEDVAIDVPSHGERAVFPCHRWLALKEDDGKLERELYPQFQDISSSKNYFSDVMLCCLTCHVIATRDHDVEIRSDHFCHSVKESCDLLAGNSPFVSLLKCRCVP